MRQKRKIEVKSGQDNVRLMQNTQNHFNEIYSVNFTKGTYELVYTSACFGARRTTIKGRFRRNRGFLPPLFKEVKSVPTRH